MGLDQQLVTEALKVLAKEYEARGICLSHGPAGWEFITDHKLGPQLSAFFEFQRKRRLSQSALETLAVVAYHQPVTRREVDEIRSVDSSHTIRVLQEKGLVKIIGQRRTPGMPYEYAVSEIFLHHFGLDSINDLPQLEIDMGHEEETDEPVAIKAAELGIEKAKVISREQGS